jgi:hypothetical protein
MLTVVVGTAHRVYGLDREESAMNTYSRAGRGVAQSGSAPALGAGGPGFESRRPDSNKSEPCQLITADGVSLLCDARQHLEGSEPLLQYLSGEGGAAQP